MTLDTEFKDHFSEGSDAYRVYRPGYPEALFRYLSSLTENHNRAWDCATGHGQTALALSNYYSEVIGTDASQNQINHAPQKEGVFYRVEKAEQSLGIGVGETTEDGEVTVEMCRCLGACSQAPVVVVDNTMHGRMHPNLMPQVLRECQNGNRGE